MYGENRRKKNADHFLFQVPIKSRRMEKCPGLKESRMMVCRELLLVAKLKRENERERERDKVE